MIPNSTLPALAQLIKPGIPLQCDRITNNNFQWLCCNQNVEKRRLLEQILPQDFNYKVNEFKISQESNVLNENTFVATVLVNICDDQEIETFLTEFKEISNTDYNKNKADTEEGKSVKVSGQRKCIHNVQKKGKQGDQGSEKWNEY